MPVIHKPTIFQQRIVLVVFLVLIGTAAWWQNAGGGDHPARKFSAMSASDPFGKFDFTNAEAGWRELQFDSQGNLRIDALTETALLDAMTLLSEQRTEAPAARMAFLLEKQFGASASQQIMALLPKLQRYKEAEQRWLAEHGRMNPPPHAELFALQDELLGETLAKELFSEQRRLVHLMLASQQIRNDSSLTQEQRDRALMDLQKATPSE